jgi:GT2 family glycosyltransferase
MPRSDEQHVASCGDRRPTFSIVVPSLNYGLYIRLALLSVLEQSYPSSLIQLIVMDGGSRDGTLAVLRELAGDLRHWQSGPDAGQAAAINAGLTLGDGDIVAWLNADDIYLPDTMARAASAFADSDVQAVYGDCCHWDVVSQRLYFVPALAPSPLLRLTGNTVCQPGCFWRRDIWHLVGGLDQRLSRFPDFDLHLRMRAAGVRYHRQRRVGAVILWHGRNKCARDPGVAEHAMLARRHALPAGVPAQLAATPARVLGHLLAGHWRWLAAVSRKRLWHRRAPRLLGAPLDEAATEALLGPVWMARLRCIHSADMNACPD